MESHFLELSSYAPWGAAFACGCGVAAWAYARRLTLGGFVCFATAVMLCSLTFIVKKNSADRGPVGNIAWEASLDGGLAKAKQAGMPAIIDFTATWCQACKLLDRQTYPDEQVRRALARFVPIKIDCTSLDDKVQALFTRYGIMGLPAVLFVDSQGNVLQSPRLTGFVGPERFLMFLSAVH